jgi:cobalt-zinc-cadmium efflux system outer membrane protein
VNRDLTKTAIAAVVVVWSVWVRAAAAQSCSPTISRDDVVRCVVRASFALERERLEQAALEGKRTAVSPLLPGNPELSLSGAHRSTGEQQAGNWYATLSQEIELAGQRSARRDEAGAALLAQGSAIRATERNVAASAWRAYFEALAARDALASANRLEQIFTQSSRAAEAGAVHGLVSGVDAEVAELNVLRLTQTRIAAERRARTSLAALTSLLGLDPTTARVQAQGELTPLTHVAALRQEQLDSSVERRDELAQLKQTRQARAFARTVLERSRVPNVKLSLIAQSDGFGERVLGGGISMPIPLPYPVGRTLHGELAENAALVRQADAEIARVKRAVRLEVIAAWQAYESARAQQALYTDERVAQAERSLASIGGELHAGRLSISDAVVAQQTLIEFLRAHIEAKLELCLASIELARSAGLRLEGTGL